jgi:hypothetical protein
MMTDAELRLELKTLHEQATRVWARLDERASRSEGFRTRHKLANRAWKLNNATWELYRDVIKEYPHG